MTIQVFLISGGAILISTLIAVLVWFINRLINTLDRIDARVYAIDTILPDISLRLKNVEESNEAVEVRVDVVESRLDVLSTEHRLKCAGGHR